MPSAEDIGARVRAARDAAGLTQAEAGERAGMHKQHWSRIERGRGGDMRISTLVAVAEALGVEVGALIDER